MKNILITGTAGFIGFHLASRLLQMGYNVVGVDNLTPYYDVKLKSDRLNILKQHLHYKHHKIDICDKRVLRNVFESNQIEVVVHLAAQAGVRYSIENPTTYFKNNIEATYNITELSVKYCVKHFMFASTSSVYGTNKNMPFEEGEKSDEQISFYAASKKMCETLLHSFSHTNSLPVTCFRFFTVYGEWGRPDMALFKFTDAILSDRAIEVYNHGDMFRDFTYVQDLVKSVHLLIDKVPTLNQAVAGDSLSSCAPWRIVNIGNSAPVKLERYIEVIEGHLGKKALKNYLPMQAGDVRATHANTTLLKNLIGYIPDTAIETGVAKFVEWYREYYLRNAL